MTKSHRLLIKIAILFLWGVFVWLILAKINSSPSLTRAIRLSTTRLPENLTELYFEDHLNLPKFISPDKQTEFKFTIHNLENQRVDYVYQIIKDVAGDQVILEENEVGIDHDNFVTIDKIIGPFDNERTKIIINLPVQDQSISFWLEKI